ncbi:hypothetical protein D3C71_1782290 [compost metagenome]
MDHFPHDSYACQHQQVKRDRRIGSRKHIEPDSVPFAGKPAQLGGTDKRADHRDQRQQQHVVGVKVRDAFVLAFNVFELGAWMRQKSPNMINHETPPPSP